MNKEQPGARRHRRGVLSLNKAQTRTNALSAPTCSWDPETYDRVSAGQRAWTAEPSRTLDLNGIERVIDLGCGTGWLAADLAKRLPQGDVLGLDISPAMIGYARQHYGSHSNCRFNIADARRLRVSQPVDLIVSTAALHWIREQNRVLRNCARALKPGGKLVIEMAGCGNAQELRECLTTIVRSPRWTQYFVNFHNPFTFSTAEEIELMLRKSSLASAEVSVYNTRLEFDSTNALSTWIRAVWLPFVRQVPDVRRTQFAMEAAQLYHRIYGTTDIQMVRIRANAMVSR